MKFKKLASLALAGVMTASLAVPAFASETEITGTYTAPDIDVVVTPSAAAFINPLGLDIEVATGVTVSGRQIISAPMTIKNQSAMDLQVDASMTATINEGSDMRFVGTTTGGVGSTKTAFAYLQATQAKDLIGADATVDATAIGTAYAAWDATAYSASTDLLVNSAMATSKANLVVVRAADMSGAGNTFAAYKPGSVALVRLAGDCVASPTAGSWTETKTEGDKTTGDGFTINVAYTFKPATVTKYDVTFNQTGGTGGEAASVDVQKAAEGDVVTVTVTNLGGSTKATVTVEDAEGNAVATAPANGEIATLNGTATFTMPAGAVTVTATFA
ncbi:MAG: hypothetical protein HFF75_01360 [Oscillospiraceae bacterium]|nr:hypothetical protein [Oscillospiraceae bacterium]